MNAVVIDPTQCSEWTKQNNTPIQNLRCSMDPVNELKLNSNRIVRSRKHTEEEKIEQRKRWRKRKLEEKKANKNGKQVSKIRCVEAVDKGSRSDALSRSVKPIPDHLARSTSAAVNDKSRGALMVQLASKRSKKALSHDAGPPRRTTTASNEAVKIRELNRDLLNYCSLKSIGSGSYGDCYLAKYRGIDVVVKQMKSKGGKKEDARAKKEVIHEGSVINSLGDTEGIPLVFGVITKSTPMCLVMQFHGINGTSITLHQASESAIISKHECISIFKKLSEVLEHIHSKGYLHNDIKSNNVILEKTSSGFLPVLIDYGKSSNITSDAKQVVQRGNRSYLAPEVVKYGQQSPLSDVFSLGYMLKSVFKLLCAYNDVKDIVKKACEKTISCRITVKDFRNKLSHLTTTSTKN